MRSVARVLADPLKQDGAERSGVEGIEVCVLSGGSVKLGFH